MELRNYQAQARDLALKKISEDLFGRYLVQMPTGMGKTVLFAAIIRDLVAQGKKILVIAHREELLFQAAAKINTMTGIVPDVILQSKPNPSAQVWVASIQTLVRGGRLALIDPDVVMVDEAHHSAAPSYHRTLDHYGKPTLGFTATPTRTRPKEKKLLAAIWSELIYQYPLRKAIADGWLARIEYYAVMTSITLDDIDDVAGDFNQEQLGRRVNVEKRNVTTVDAYCDHGRGKGIAFCVDVPHTHNLRDAFRQRGIRCESVTGDTPTDERRAIISEFLNAPINEDFVLTNCMVLTEGFDCPDVRIMLLARPTQSEIVYLQQLGRGLRTAPGKDCCVVVDIADCCKNKAIQNCLTTVFQLDRRLQGRIVGDVEQGVRDLEKRKAQPREQPSGQEIAELELRNIFFDIPEEFNRSALAWIAPDERYYHVDLDKDGNFFRIENRDLDYRLVRGNSHTSGVTEVLVSADINEVNSAATRIARDEYFATEYIWGKAKRGKWGKAQVTDAQRALLKKLAPEIDPDTIDKGTASQIISAKSAQRNAEPATPKQISFLRWQGVPPTRLNGITKVAASRMISEIKDGGNW